MRNAGILLSGLVTIILCLMFIPKDIVYIIGCYQVGSWIGGFLSDKLD